MRLTYDKDADAAYIYLEAIPPGGAKKTIPWGQPPLRELFLDFNDDGKLVGIEVLDASRLLTKGTLESAT